MIVSIAEYRRAKRLDMRDSRCVFGYDSSLPNMAKQNAASGVMVPIVFSVDHDRRDWAAGCCDLASVSRERACSH
jgi:hypothetical protein